MIIDLKKLFTQEDQREGEPILFHRIRDSGDVFKKIPCIYTKSEVTVEVNGDLLNFDIYYEFRLVVTSKKITYDLPFCPIEHYGMFYTFMLQKS